MSRCVSSNEQSFFILFQRKYEQVYGSSVFCPHCAFPQNKRKGKNKYKNKTKTRVHLVKLKISQNGKNTENVHKKRNILVMYIYIYFPIFHRTCWPPTKLSGLSVISRAYPVSPPLTPFRALSCLLLVGFIQHSRS